MNHYDKEENIIKLLQATSYNDIHFVNRTSDVRKFFCSLYRENEFKNWINSSGKDDMPPDFFSDKYRYMLEVMRVDDYVAGNNSPNALESKKIKEIDDIRRRNGLRTISEANITALIIPDMSKSSENNYSIYIENYKRIINKHIKKIENYRQNHPGYKLGFLIFDESPGYVMVTDKNIKPKKGDIISAFQHVYIRDKNLIGIFEGKDLDFVIWMTPYKNFPPNPKVYPEICVFDMMNKSAWKRNLIEYKTDEMLCLEVE